MKALDMQAWRKSYFFIHFFLVNQNIKRFVAEDFSSEYIMKWERKLRNNIPFQS